MRDLVVATLAGAVAVLVLVSVFAVLGRVFGEEPVPPWMCDDTRYVDTVPVGRGVVGPAVSAPPGCGQ